MTKALAFVLLTVGGCVATGDPTAADPPPRGIAVADPAVALTFARTEGTRRVLAVTRYRDGMVEGVDVSSLFARPVDDPVPLLLAGGYDALRRGLDGAAPRHRVSLPARELGVPLDLRALHVGVGLNFPAHADESDAGTEPFLFPKATAPTGPWAPVSAAGRLLDYEVELAWVPLGPLGVDGGPAAIGLVVCNDYTDREALLRAIDPWDPGSGRGFTTGKSFEGSLPIGPFLVVPRDVRAFVQGLELRLWVNGRLRQRAPATAMTWTLDRLVAETLARADRAWDHGGTAARLPVDDGRIPARTLLMSGTPDGTVFQAIGLGARLRGAAGWVLGGFRRPVADHVIDAYLRDAHAARIYLQPGDRVVASVDGVGIIENEVIP